MSEADTTTAVVFPGQGTQRAGMARDFHDAFEESRRVFAEASDALGLDVAALCFDDADRLALTEFVQPAILTAEIAMLRAAESRFGCRATVYAGHSLGEYTALVAAGVVGVGPAAALVRERGRLMQEAVPAGEGGMTAVVMPNVDVERIRSAIAGLAVDLANHNSTDQAVLSGLSADLEQAASRIRALDGYERARCIPLRVSAPFHSRLMAPAEAAFRAVIERDAIAWNAAPAAQVASNFLGDFHEPRLAAVVDALARQISAPVRWLDDMRCVAARAGRIVEIGPGKPLKAFFATLGVTIESVTDVAGAERVFAGC
jgi:[acyl-carrier-protein] S-malonyltransferase